MGLAHKKPAVDTSIATSNVRVILLSQIVPNPNQPRRAWDDEKDEDGRNALERLAESIKAQGVLQPLVVTNWEDKYLIVCGERRYRAAKQAGLKEVPCVLRPGLNGEQVLELSIIENLQREDLTPVDEAHAIDALMKRCGWSQAAVGKRLGVARAAVNYKLGLLKLSPELQKDVKKGKLSETQGRAIGQATNKAPEEKRPEIQKEVHEKVAKARESGAKVDTKGVATIARTVVEKHTQPVAVAPIGGKPAPAKKPEPVQPPTSKEKAQAEQFTKAIMSVGRTLAPFDAALKERPQRSRFAYVLLTARPEAADKARSVLDFFGRILEEVAEQRRQRMVNKLG